MKRLLAILLAAMMMGTIALAAVGDALPGDVLEFGILSGGTLDVGSYRIAHVNPGSENPWASGEITSKTFSVTNVRWTKGSDLVKSLTIDDDGYLVLALKANYTLKGSKNKSIVGTFKITQKGKNKTNEYKVDGITVGYDEKTVSLSFPYVAADEDTIYIFEKDGNTSYGTAFFTDSLGNDIEVRVYDKEEYYLYSNSNANLDIVKKYDNTDATLDFVTFPGAPSFSSSAKYYIYTDEDNYVYAVKNGALTASGAKWDKDLGCYIITSRNLGSYVISDKKLSVSAGTTGGTTGTGGNPDTGANDVVGIATALAAVALVSAAAVSMKRR